MAGPAIFGGSRTKIITSKGLLLKDGTPIDFNGPKNYVTRGTFSTNETTGWSLKRTTLSGLIPNQVAASWTTPSVLTLSATTTGALTNSGYSLSLAASAATTAGDMLVSDAYTIDIEDQAKVLNFKFSYKAYANASNLNFSGTSSNTFHVYIYDVTNNAWIQPAGCYTMVQNSGVGIGYGTFQTPANMTQFRIAIVSCNASSGAFTLYTDNFFVGPQQFNMGPPVTDWVSYTPTITSATGAVSNYTSYGKWRRVGDKLEGEIVLEFSSTSSAFLRPIATIPAGLTIDTSKFPGTTIPDRVVGNANILDNSVNNYPATVCYAGVSQVYISAHGIATHTGTVPVNLPEITNTFPFTLNSGDKIFASFSVPIVGWSSNTVMSSDAATNVVAFKGYNSGGSIANGGTPVVVPLSTATVNQGGFTFTSGASANVVVPTSGIYKISVTIGYTAAATGTQIVGYKINSGSFVGIGVRGAPPIYDSIVGNDTLSLNAGDVIYMMAVNNNTTALTIDGARILLERISGPAQIAASETVAFEAYSTSGAAIGTSLGDVVFGTVVSDATNSYNASTGVFTAPVSGRYQFNYTVGTANVNLSTLQRFIATLYYSGAATDVGYGSKMFGGGVLQGHLSMGSTQVRMLAGETVKVRAVSDVSTTQNTVAYTCKFSGVKVGNY